MVQSQFSRKKTLRELPTCTVILHSDVYCAVHAIVYVMAVIGFNDISYTLYYEQMQGFS